MIIKQAETIDHKAISELTFRSKAYWGYSPEQILNWRVVLEISAEHISTHQVFKALQEEEIIGYYSYGAAGSKTVLLDSLFVEPDYIGKGVGKLLMMDFLKRVEKENITTITLEADPNAVRFYKQWGFKTIKEIASSIPGRYLPIMEKTVNEHERSKNKTNQL